MEIDKVMTNTRQSGKQVYKQDWSTVKKWLDYSPDIIERIRSKDASRYDRMKSRIRDYACFTIASQRIKELEAEVSSDDRSNKLIATIIVTVIAAFFYGRAAYLLFAILGLFAFPAAIGVGLVAGFTLDWLITKTLTNKLIAGYMLQVKQDKTEEETHKLENARTKSDLHKDFLDETLRFIKQKELQRYSSVAGGGVPINLIMAISLNAIEFLSAYLLINQIFAEAIQIPSYLQFILGLLPIAISWAVGNIKAQSFGLSEYHQKSISLYEEYLNPSNESFQKLIEERKLEDDKLDAGIRILLRDVVNENMPTADASDYFFDLQFFSEEKLIHEKKRDTKIADRSRKYNSDKIALTDEYAKRIRNAIKDIPKNLENTLEEISKNNDPVFQREQLQRFRQSLDNNNFTDRERIAVQRLNDEMVQSQQLLQENFDFDKLEIFDSYKSLIAFYQEQIDEAENNYKKELARNQMIANNMLEIESLKEKIDEASSDY